jgi:hypothetical protein
MGSSSSISDGFSFYTVTLLLGSFLSYPSPNAESDAVAENAVLSDWNTCDFSLTYGWKA